MIHIWQRLCRFFREEIWNDVTHPTRIPRYVLRNLRIVFIVGRGFNDDKCFLRASALTYTTLLALVPLLAFGFSLAKGLAGDEAREQLRGVLERVLPPNVQAPVERSAAESPGATAGTNAEGVTGTAAEDENGQVTADAPAEKDLVGAIITYVERTNLKALGGVGLLILVWTVVKALGTMESTFNDIWGVKTHRSFVRKFADYTSVLLICPILLIAATGLTATLASNSVTDYLLNRQVLDVAYKIGPFIGIWAAFAAFYVFMPNTQVSRRSAIIGGIVAGTLWQVMLWGYTHFQVGVAKYDAIYGAFSALPIFLVWLYLSWVILLFGAELSFAHQNVETFSLEEGALEVSFSDREWLVLAMTIAVSERFAREESAWGDADLAHYFGVPVRLVRDVLHDLVGAGILTETAAETFQPAIALDRLTSGRVLDAIRGHSSEDLSPQQTPEGDRAAALLQAVYGEDPSGTRSTPIESGRPAPPRESPVEGSEENVRRLLAQTPDEPAADEG